MNEHETKVIAFCGKGGAGKTSLCALVIKFLMEKKKKILAIDADPAGGLSWALGILPAKTLDDLRQMLSESLSTKKVTSNDELFALAQYELLSSLIENKGFDFLSVGRPESEGCFCSINAFLRHCIRTLAQHYDYVCIDGEAGLEQVNRRVLETVTHLVIVSDTSKKSLAIADNLITLAAQRTQTMHKGVIINKWVDSTCKLNHLPVLGLLPVSHTIAKFDAEGKSLIDMREDDAYYAKLKEVMKNFV